MRVDRVDTGSKLGKFLRNGAGAVRVPATIARTGLQDYIVDGKKLVEYRPPEEVFSAASLASLAGVPVTLRHPKDSVTRDNAREVQVGHTSDLPPEAHVKVDGSADEWIKASLYVADGGVQDAIERDEAGTISCGYSCRLEMTPGTTPDGRHYDAIQRDIQFNHVAILTAYEQPRAGGQAKLRLDSKENPMKIVVIDGVEYEQGSDKHIAKLNSDAAAAVAKANARADKAEAERDTQKERADKAEAAITSDKIDELVEERISILTRAAKLLPGSYETKGKSNAQVCADAVAEKLGADKVAGKSADYVAARFDSLTDADQPAQYHKPVVSAVKADSASKSNINDSDEAFRASLAAKSGAKEAE
jgi:hypothetical protein